VERIALGFILVLASAGCASTAPSAGPTGVGHAARLDRVRGVAWPLLGRCGAVAPRLELMGGVAPAAYSWPDGRIVVSSGLVDVLDDKELAAAIAHEIGHLLNDGHLGTGVAALSGSGASGSDEEERADETGARLLAACRFPPEAMARMLGRVKDSPHAPADCRAGLARRIERLRGAGW
jgi:hypothetical protein